MYVTILALEKHLCDSCGSAKVTVDLEWRMCVEQVGVGSSLLRPLCRGGCPWSTGSRSALRSALSHSWSTSTRSTHCHPLASSESRCRIDQGEHIAEDEECVVSVKHTGPEIGLPSKAPSGCLVSALDEGYPCSVKEFRCVRIDLVGRIESVKV